MAKTRKAFLVEKNGSPVSLLVPPGTVTAAANTTVTIRAPIIVQEPAVFFNHCSPSFIRSLCF
ncbi:hypothetical protein LguiB_021631 [Lonicera macranthoides]